MSFLFKVSYRVIIILAIVRLNVSPNDSMTVISRLWISDKEWVDTSLNTHSDQNSVFGKLNMFFKHFLIMGDMCKEKKCIYLFKTVNWKNDEKYSWKKKTIVM